MAKIRQFGNTWWGRAWLDALEQRALVDPNRLPRGRTYARQDRVRDVELAPGRLAARVQGTQLYRTSLSLRVLSGAEWDTVLDVVMDRASNVAALLAGEVPSAIGAMVLPDRGDLGPECSCPDWAEPCKHVAALCYVAADLFDADPFALLTLRGRSRDEVLTEVRARRSARLGVAVATTSNLPRGADPGISASAAYRREAAALDRGPTVANRPGTMPPIAVAPGADTGIDVGELRALAADAAQRAWAMLAGDGDSGLTLSVGADVVRRAASGDVAAIAAHTNVAEAELRAAVAAWHVGGIGGFRVHTDRHDGDAALLASGSDALGHGARVRANTVSLGSTQLRVDPDRRWWRFHADDALGWVLVDGPSDDPTELVANRD